MREHYETGQKQPNTYQARAVNKKRILLRIFSFLFSTLKERNSVLDCIGTSDNSLQPMPVGRLSSAFAVDIASPAWLSW